MFLSTQLSTIDFYILTKSITFYNKKSQQKSLYTQQKKLSIIKVNKVDEVNNKYFDYKFSSNQNELKDKSDVHYFKLPYIGNLSHHIKNKLSKLCKEFCKENFNIKLVFNSFKIKNYFSYKGPIPNDLKSFLV